MEYLKFFTQHNQQLPEYEDPDQIYYLSEYPPPLTQQEIEDLETLDYFMSQPADGYYGNIPPDYNAVENFPASCLLFIAFLLVVGILAFGNIIFGRNERN
jgi:hypothetical protein